MASDVEKNSQGDSTFTQAILGDDTLTSSWGRRWLALSFSARVVLATAGFAALLFVPYLGAVGLWDPWETHYGEVGRQMIQRADYVYPFWENAWFFSKPPLTMWMQALGMNIVGALRGDGAMGLYTEWGMRMPFALLSITAVALLSLAVARIVNMRAGLATGFVLATMPLYFLLTRQTVTDTPFVTTFVCAMACALIGQLDDTTKHRAGWWYAFYVFAGLATLAKGLLGVGLPAVILVLYAAAGVIPWNRESLEAHLRWLASGEVRAQVRAGTRAMPVLWAQMYRMKLGTGILVFAAVAVPWYLTLCLFDGVDDEGKLFWYRFFIHDHLNRLTAGVHTTTPGGSFTYFIEQGGFAIFPWVALLPGAFAVVSRLKLRSRDKADHLALIAVLWVAFAFYLLASSATKFHHYVFPVLPGLAILISLFVDRLWKDGVSEHAVSLIFGLILFILVGKDLAENPKDFTDLFVYNYDRPYPQDLVTKPIAFFSSRPLWMGDLVTLVLLAFGVYLAFDAFSSKAKLERPAAARAVALGLLLTGGATLAAVATQGQVSAMGLWGVALVALAGFLIWQASRPEEAPGRTVLQAVGFGLALVGVALAVRGFKGPPASDALFKALSGTINVKVGMGFAFGVAGVLAAVAALQRSRVLLFSTFWGLAAAFALWFNWGHWVDLSHHWTQRDLFWRYYDQRKPGEPIAAYMMNWRGETFYSRNTVEQFRANDANTRMRQYAARPGREWALVEHNRVNLLRTAVGSDKTVTLVDRDINNKFVLVTIE
ncbi:glycosyltransferase family 39 protein [Corallococcus exiguus]|uniref:ArnT family glycosyltransferase n=1 Tax=Corallococcus TaxID=83461 RepID=UPI000ECA8F6D|nr:glycosyltransferase family 39 protein [Corallococcus sp. AB032C]NNB89629.1 glycosyltransferase family 39 protein [Corallococcus exiguus]NNB97238.1 glycosyltransferase family 39 protein [Corallococcus exiguus]NPC49986.1 glycosyltransferase family 39 protein [Corallococcus exiguus]RKH77557.1 glycosyltransferase family 39 protein [Corallococcus sp. AB032C]